MATFCLIHGNWHDGTCWDAVVAGLRARGHEAVAPDLPIDDASAGWQPRIAPILDAADGAAQPLVLVAHSASSDYGALAAARLGDPVLVHLCPRLEHFQSASAPPPFRPNFPFPPRGPDGASAWSRDAAIEVMYPRLDAAVAERLARSLRPSAPAPGPFPLKDHPAVATELIYTTDDEFFEPEYERFMARELLGIEPIELPGGHFPMAEDPNGLVGVLDRLAQREVG